MNKSNFKESRLMTFDNFRNFDGVEYGNVLHNKIKQFLSETIDMAEFEGYKKGVHDEIECVETSGEHLDLQKKIQLKSLSLKESK